MGKTKILYDGVLKEKSALKIDIGIGNITIKHGEPYLLATNNSLGGHVNLVDNGKVQTINGNKCSLEIHYPKDKDLDIRVSTGNIILEDLDPKNLNISLIKGNLGLDLKKKDKNLLGIDVETGRISGFIDYDIKKNSDTEINLVKGIIDLRFKLPKNAGFESVLNNNFKGIVNIPENSNGKPKLTLRINFKRGIIKIKR
jgi:hypothetical protein